MKKPKQRTMHNEHIQLEYIFMIKLSNINRATQASESFFKKLILIIICMFKHVLIKVKNGKIAKMRTK